MNKYLRALLALLWLSLLILTFYSKIYTLFFISTVCGIIALVDHLLSFKEDIEKDEIQSLAWNSKSELNKGIVE